MRDNDRAFDDTISAAHVMLRRAAADDAEHFARWRAEPATRHFQPLQPRTADQLRARLADQAQHALGPTVTADLLWIITAAAGPVGWISLKDINREHRTAAIGYTIATVAHGRGYATAAVRQLISLAFSASGADLARLEAVAAVQNVASRRVLERAGFTLEGIARGYLVIGGKRVDHARYGLLRDDAAPYDSNRG